MGALSWGERCGFVSSARSWACTEPPCTASFTPGPGRHTRWEQWPWSLLSATSARYWGRLGRYLQAFRNGCDPRKPVLRMQNPLQPNPFHMQARNVLKAEREGGKQIYGASAVCLAPGSTHIRVSLSLEQLLWPRPSAAVTRKPQLPGFLVRAPELCSVPAHAHWETRTPSAFISSFRGVPGVPAIQLLELRETHGGRGVCRMTLEERAFPVWAPAPVRGPPCSVIGHLALHEVNALVPPFYR